VTLVNADTGEIVDTLESCEAVIERGLATFFDVGNALATIRDARLYRADFDSFEMYCRTRWNFDASRARQLIAAAETVTTVTLAGGPAPKNEGQARALNPLKDQPEKMAEAMKAAGPAPTADRIRDAVKDIVREEVAKAAGKAEAKAEDRAALEDLARNIEKAGMGLDEDRQAERGAFARLCRDLAAFPKPAKFLAGQRQYLKPRHRMGAQLAHDWLTELLNEWGDQ
jgi:hypothetical protein